MDIIFIEDNPAIVKGLEYPLQKEGYSLTSFSCAADARAYFAKEGRVLSDAIVLLDVGLPDGDGFALYERSIRSSGLPVIFLTAKDEEDDIVRGFSLGAEDYVTKPFSTRELISRINRIAARCRRNTLVRIMDITYDLDKMEVNKGAQTVELTGLERKLFDLMIRERNHIVSRSLLLDKIWEWTGNDVDDHTVTVYFRRLREKLGDDIIKTVRGVGYRVDEA